MTRTEKLFLIGFIDADLCLLARLMKGGDFPIRHLLVALILGIIFVALRPRS